MDYGQPQNHPANYSRHIPNDDESNSQSIHLEDFNPAREPRKGERRTIYNVVEGAPPPRASSHAPADLGTPMDQNSSSAFHHYGPGQYPQEESLTYGQATSKYFTKFDGSGRTTIGRWTKEEHEKFLEALKIYGKEWSRVQEMIKTRSSGQIRSHAQKFFDQLKKKGGAIEILNTKKGVIELHKYSPNSGDDPRLTEQTRAAMQKNLYKFENQPKKLQLDSPTHSNGSGSDNGLGEKSAEREHPGFAYKKKAPPVIQKDHRPTPDYMQKPLQQQVQPEREVKPPSAPTHERAQYGGVPPHEQMQVAPMSEIRINNQYPGVHMKKPAPENLPQEHHPHPQHHYAPRVEAKGSSKTLDLRAKVRAAQVRKRKESRSSNSLSQMSKKIYKQEGFNKKDFIKVQRLRNTELSASEKSESSPLSEIEILAGVLAEEAERQYRALDPNPSPLKRFGYQLQLIVEQKKQSLKQSSHMRVVHRHLCRITVITLLLCFHKPKSKLQDILRQQGFEETIEEDWMSFVGQEQIYNYQSDIERISKEFARSKSNSILHQTDNIEKRGPFRHAKMITYAHELKKEIEDLNVLIIKLKDLLDMSTALAHSTSRLPEQCASLTEKAHSKDLIQENILLNLELSIQKKLVEAFYHNLVVLFDKYFAAQISDITCLGPLAKSCILPVHNEGADIIKKMMDKAEKLQQQASQPTFAQVVPASHLIPAGDEFSIKGSIQQPFSKRAAPMVMDPSGASYIVANNAVQPIYATSMETGSNFQFPVMLKPSNQIMLQPKMEGPQLSRFSIQQGQPLGNGTPPESDANQIDMMKNQFQIGEIDTQSRQTAGQMNKFNVLMPQQSGLPTRKLFTMQGKGNFQDTSSRIQTSGSQAPNHATINAFTLGKHLPTAAPQTRQYQQPMLAVSQISQGGIHLMQSAASESGFHQIRGNPQSANPIQRQAAPASSKVRPLVLGGGPPSQTKSLPFVGTNKVSAQNSSVQQIQKGHGESNSVTAGFPHNVNSDFRGGGGHSSFGVQLADGQSMNSRRDGQLPFQQQQPTGYTAGQTAFSKQQFE